MVMGSVSKMLFLGGRRLTLVGLAGMVSPGLTTVDCFHQLLALNEQILVGCPRQIGAGSH